MRTIHKYPLVIADEQRLRLPTGATPLSAQAQGVKLCLWAEVETGNLNCDWDILIFGTGHQMPNRYDFRYISTVQLLDGQVVYHIYARENP